MVVISLASSVSTMGQHSLYGVQDFISIAAVVSPWLVSCSDIQHQNAKNGNKPPRLNHCHANDCLLLLGVEAS